MSPSSPTPIHLDTLAVIEAARAAHTYGLLTAQAPSPGDRKLKYEYRGRVCAIGASVAAERIGDEDEIGAAISNSVELSDIQYAHDRWANAGHASRNDHERAFLRTLSEVGGCHG